MRPLDITRQMRVRDLGFLEDPFSDSTDPHLFCPVASHVAIYDGVVSVIQKELGFCVVSGPEGIGKSILANRLVSCCLGRPEDFRPYLITDSAVSQLDAEAVMLRTIADRLGTSRKRSAEKQCRGIIDDVKRNRSVTSDVPVVIIDTNLKVSRQSLSWLSSIGRESCPVVLFMRYSVDDEPRRNSKPVEIDYQATLSPLTMQDCWEIVRYRCASVSQSIRLFDGNVFRYIWDASSGVPAGVIRICSGVIDQIKDLSSVPVSLDVVNSVIEDMYPRLGYEEII